MPSPQSDSPAAQVEKPQSSRLVPLRRRPQSSTHATPSGQSISQSLLCCAHSNSQLPPVQETIQLESSPHSTRLPSGTLPVQVAPVSHSTLHAPSQATSHSVEQVQLAVHVWMPPVAPFVVMVDPFVVELPSGSTEFNEKKTLHPVIESVASMRIARFILPSCPHRDGAATKRRESKIHRRSDAFFVPDGVMVTCNASFGLARGM